VTDRERNSPSCARARGVRAGFRHDAGPPPGRRDWSEEICYQVYVRSFRDGGGDGVGDFRGLIEGLGYLQALGVTSLWLNPVFPSPTHHNYFPTDFFATDPAFGSLGDFAALCRAVHARGMRILLDAETQYVPESHPWFREARADPDSPLRRRFLFREDAPDEWLHLRFGLPTDDGQVSLALKEMPILNLADPGVVDFQRRFYRFWLDPLGAGDRAGGVDGYRLDHVMDDLDGHGVLTGLMRDFWRPLIGHVRAADPEAFFLAEPADWKSAGDELLREADIDGVFAIPLMFALRELDAEAIADCLRRTLAGAVTGRSPFLILENHDVTRFATAVGEDPAAERLGAVLNLTLPGVPTLYYGQEIGMTGRIGTLDEDVHLAAREAFRWRRNPDAPGMAVWYRDHAFWAHARIRRDDGRTLEDQRNDPDSLWHWYRRLIALRRRSPALCRGDFELFDTGHRDVLAFRRRHEAETVTVVANVSARTARLAAGSPALGEDGDHLVLASTGAEGGSTLPPLGVRIRARPAPTAHSGASHADGCAE
jgi:glycosidase